MSAKGKAKSKVKRLKAKRSKRQVQQALYEGYRDKGINTKSKRACANARKTGVTLRSHPVGTCGNDACDRCNCGARDRFPKKFFKDGLPHLMPQWMFEKWLTLNVNYLLS
jgi:hypothetical protein